VIARAFEKTVYTTHAKRTLEKHLGPTQFAYRTGGNCTDALLAIQDHILSNLDKSDCTAVRVFAMDFSKAFDSIKHNLLSDKLKCLKLNPYIINWYINFLKDRQQRVTCDDYLGNWKYVNKGTTQGSVSGPYLFNIFIDDLALVQGSKAALYKYADDTTIISPVFKDSDDAGSLVRRFMEWTDNNSMKCNPKKCKELIFTKKGHTVEHLTPIMNIPQHNELSLLGVTFQNDSKFKTHVHSKLVKANRSLHVLRSLRKEGLNQQDIDHLFKSLIMPSLNYGLPVYGASKSDLNTVQCFLERCSKRKFTSKRMNIVEIMESHDRKIMRKVEMTENHPIKMLIPCRKQITYNLRKTAISRPKVNTTRYEQCFKNRLHKYS